MNSKFFSIFPESPGKDVSGYEGEGDSWPKQEPDTQKPTNIPRVIYEDNEYDEMFQVARSVTLLMIAFGIVISGIILTATGYIVPEEILKETFSFMLGIIEGE